jgi:hypothetical protein
VTNGCCGTCTRTVPVCPGRLGLTIVEVTGTERPLLVLVIVTKGDCGDCGTCTRTVPVWPGRVGTAMVDVIVAVPEYVEVSVVNSKGDSGTWTRTVPVWPGRLGLAIVEVTGTDRPLLVLVIVTKGDCGDCGTCTRTVPVCPGSIGTAMVDVIVAVPEYVEVSVVNWKGDGGTWTRTVPVCPGRVGLTIVEVAGTNRPLFVLVIVTNSCCGTCTKTVPI